MDAKYFSGIRDLSAEELELLTYLLEEEEVEMPQQEVRSPDQAVISGPIPLLPRAMNMFKDMPVEPHNYSCNFVILLEAVQALDPTRLQQAVRRTLLHHDALRLHFMQTSAGWQQFIAAPDDAIPCNYCDLSLIPQQLQAWALEAAVAEFRSSLNLADGPLCRFVLFDLGADQSQRLLVIVHHLTTDRYSFSIVLDDLHTAYVQLSRGKAVRLPAKTTSIKHWAETLTAYAESRAIRQESDYWLALPWAEVRPLPVDYPAGRGSDTEATTAILTASLGTSETHMLLHLPTAGDTHVLHILLAALAQALKRWTGEPIVLVETIHHGRDIPFEDIDLSRTVG